MESNKETRMSIEEMIISVGSYLFNEAPSASVTNIETQFLKDLKLLLEAELERREAHIH
jgi:hypothetical protein